MATTGRTRGRPPKSAAQKIAEGNLGKRKIPEPLVVLNDDDDNDGSIPQCPPMGTEGKTMWRNIWKAATWLEPSADFYAVLDACRNFEEYELLRLEREIGIFERTYITPQGQELSHPKIGQLKDARQALSVSLSDIGFTPRGRAQLEMSSATEGDPIDVHKQNMAERREQQLNKFKEIMEAHDGKL